MGAVHACYHHAVAPDLQVGVELETNYAQQESTTNVGFQYELPKVRKNAALCCSIFSRVLRDSTTRFVGPSLSLSVHRSVTLYFFGVFAVFNLTAPAQMIK